MIKATRLPASPARRAGGPEAVRYDVQAAWPGITAGFDARCQCTWAMRAGTYQVKHRNAMCPSHPRTVHGG